MESATENKPPKRIWRREGGNGVGRAHRAGGNIPRQGKPRLEQDQIEEYADLSLHCLFRADSRVGC